MPAYDERSLWVVPSGDAGEAGTLLSDRIAYYVDLVKLVDPYDPSALRPASYDLKVGDAYYRDDIVYELQTGEPISIPPNGLVYVKTGESLNIPYYMVARYSLRVTQVYRGLLIDNGLQVDPGYHGPIWIPVHNLTDQRRTLKRGENFVSMEFVKTTTFPLTQANAFLTEQNLVERGGELKGIDGKAIRLFHKPSGSFRQPKGPKDLWLSGETHKSATEQAWIQLNQLKEDSATFEKRLERQYEKLQNISQIAALALLLAAGIGVMSFYYWFSDRYTEMVWKNEQALSESRRVQEQQKEITRLIDGLHKAEEKLKTIEEKSPRR